MSDKINIVQIQTALCLPVTAQYITGRLKIPPAEQQGRALLWNASDFTHICQGLITEITAARNADFAKITPLRPKKEEPPDASDPFEEEEDFFS